MMYKKKWDKNTLYEAVQYTGKISQLQKLFPNFTIYSTGATALIKVSHGNIIKCYRGWWLVAGNKEGILEMYNDKDFNKLFKFVSNE